MRGAVHCSYHLNRRNHAELCAHKGCGRVALIGGESCSKHEKKEAVGVCSHEGCKIATLGGRVCPRHERNANAKICAHEGCNNLSLENFGRVTGAQFCTRHAKQAKKKRCSQEGCTNASHRGGLCSSHFKLTVGDPTVKSGEEQLKSPPFPEGVEVVESKSPSMRHPAINLIPRGEASSVLSDYNNFLVQNIEFFYPSSDNRLGLRCIHCKNTQATISIPGSIKTISSGLGSLGARHICAGKCPFIQSDIVQRMIETKNTSELQSQCRGRVNLSTYIKNLAKQWGMFDDEMSGVCWVEGTEPDFSVADEILPTSSSPVHSIATNRISIAGGTGEGANETLSSSNEDPSNIDTSAHTSWPSWRACIVSGCNARKMTWGEYCQAHFKPSRIGGTSDARRKRKPARRNVEEITAEQKRTPSLFVVKKCSIVECTNDAMPTQGGMCCQTHAVRPNAKLCTYKGCGCVPLSGGECCLKHEKKEAVGFCSHEGCNIATLGGRVCPRHERNANAKICAREGCNNLVKNYPHGAQFCLRHSKNLRDQNSS